MKTILLSVATALLASGLAITLAYVSGAHGETFRIIAVATLIVSCATALVASSIGLFLRKKKEALG